MKDILSVAAIVTASVIGTAAFADDMFWVVGNRAANSCDIVTRNPVIDGNIWFGDGPYKSMSDAKLARSTIRACPPVPEPAPADQPAQADDNAGTAEQAPQ